MGIKSLLVVFGEGVPIGMEGLVFAMNFMPPGARAGSCTHRIFLVCLS